MHNILNYTREELNSLLEKDGFPGYRSKQIYQWLYTKYIDDFNEMTNLPIDFRQRLKNKYSCRFTKIIKKQVSKIDGTTKFLFELDDKQTIETVLIFHNTKMLKQRKTLCVSTQVGCPLGCVFCATGQMGLKRNLTTGEIIGQILSISKLYGKLDNIVYMGMGEPLLNYDNVLRSVRIITDEMGLNFSSRKITISTSGLVPEIKKLSNENIPLTLAISLHAANNELRNKLIPINKKYPLEDLLEAVKYFINKTNRKVTFEYIIAKDINDSVSHAKELAVLLKGFLCNVNIIPANPIPGFSMKRPNTKTIANFVQILQSKGIETVIRSEKGSDIDAACGQLKTKSDGND